MSKIQSICVYCGSSPGNDPIYKQAAQKLGQAFAHANIGLVYGGGSRGIMGAIARSVKENGGRVTGIIPQFLISKEAPDSEADVCDEVIVTETMHQRKHLMFERSDAFVTLPGGIGTLEEIIEMMTWAQLGRHKKPLAFANIAGFWNPLTSLINHMANEGFIHSTTKLNPLFVDRIEDVVPEILRAAESTS